MFNNLVLPAVHNKVLDCDGRIGTVKEVWDAHNVIVTFKDQFGKLDSMFCMVPGCEHYDPVVSVNDDFVKELMKLKKERPRMFNLVVKMLHDNLNWTPTEKQVKYADSLKKRAKECLARSK